MIGHSARMQVKVMPDYQCWPLWREDEVGNVDPASLDITSGLRDRLLDWAKQYDATLNRDDPAASGFSSPETEEVFERAGRAIAVEIQNELIGKATVRYWRDHT
jgi:hypothetical protein